VAALRQRPRRALTNAAEVLGLEADRPRDALCRTLLVDAARRWARLPSGGRRAGPAGP